MSFHAPEWVRINGIRYDRKRSWWAWIARRFRQKENTIMNEAIEKLNAWKSIEPARRSWDIRVDSEDYSSVRISFGDGGDIRSAMSDDPSADVDRLIAAMFLLCGSAK